MPVARYPSPSNLKKNVEINLKLDGTYNEHC